MIHKNSKKRKHIKKVKKSIGGKPLLRNSSQDGITSSQTIHNVLQNIDSIRLLSDPILSLYGFFFKIDLIQPTNLYVNVEVLPNANRLVSSLGYKIILIAPGGDRQYYLHQRLDHKNTTTPREFINEVRVQYSVFTNSYKEGANNLTPGIVYAHILDNAQAITHLTNLRTHVSTAPKTYIAVDNANINISDNDFLTYLIQVLSTNPTWRIGGVFMELFTNSKTVRTRINEIILDNPSDVNNRIYDLENFMRWALLRSAVVSGYLHADYHKDNFLWSNNTGFFSQILYRAPPLDNDLQESNLSIQIIDWGRHFENAGLLTQITTLFANISNFLSANPVREIEAIASIDPIWTPFTTLITQIFTAWPNSSNGRYNLTGVPYTWLLSTGFSAKAIICLEKRYRLNFTRVNSNPEIYLNTILAPDRQIVNSLSSLQ